MSFVPHSARGILAAVLLLAAWSTPAAGAHLHVSPSGTGSCTSQADSCDLATSFATAVTGDEILIHAGVHGISGTVQDAVPGVTVRGAPHENRPVLDLSSGTLSLTAGTDLSALDIVSTAGTAVVARGSLIEHVRVNVTGNATVGLDLGDGAVLRGSAVTAAGANATGVLVPASGGRTELRGATVLASGPGSAAVRVSPSAPGSSSSLRAVNSILDGTGGALDVRAVSTGAQTATVVLDHSASSAPGHSASGPGSAIDATRSPMVADPLFMDRGNGDLRQSPLSPTIDAGTPDIDGDGDVDSDDSEAGGDTDLDQTPRRLGVPDIGADEREMPPIVVSTEAVFEGDSMALRITVQPRGLATDVAAEWDTGFPESSSSSPGIRATGNELVVLTFAVGYVPAGTQVVVRTRASNSAGTAVSELATVEVPASVGSGPVKPGIAPTPTVAPPAAALLPGGLPILRSQRVRPHWGIVDFRLTCKQTISCRGMIILTRLGGTRWAIFKIPPGATRTVKLTLQGAQIARARKAGKRGVRALLEIRSTQMGSSFAAVRLVGPITKPATPKKTAKP